MRVLIACEFSGIVREAFKARGHDAWSCDLLPTEIPGKHYECSVLDILNCDWNLMIAHPPCTYLANSGVRWLYDDKLIGFKNLDRWDKLRHSIKFFKSIFNAPVPLIAVENPIPHKYSRDGFITPVSAEIIEGIGKYTQIIQPWQFGHTTSKATCFWLRGLPKLKPTSIIPKEQRTFEIHREPPGPNRQKNRSRTFQGIADAMAEQWGVTPPRNK